MFRNRLVPSLWEQLFDLHENLQRTCEPAISPRPLLPPAYPTINVWEDGGRVVVEAKLPGVPTNRLEVTVAAEQLTVEGERPDAERAGTWHQRERSVGRFRRIVSLPAPVVVDGATACFEQGVLAVTLPKKPIAQV